MVPRCVRRRAFSGAQGQIFLPCDLCLMRKVVYGLLPWERKLVDVMMEDLGSAIFGGAKKTKLPDHNNHRGDDFFFATSAHEMPNVML